MPATEYFRRDGQPLSREQALDPRGILRDGVIARTRMQMRDSASRFTDGRSFWDANRASLLVTDARAFGGTEGNKPGFRILDSAVNAQDRANAYRDYEDDLTNAWKGNFGSSRGTPPPGAYPYSAAAEGTACTVNGEPGRLVKQGAWLVCTPTTKDARTSDEGTMTCPDCGGNGIQAGHACPLCGGSGEVDLDNDDEYEDATTATTTASRNLDQMRASHQQNMDRIYAQITNELENAWRNGS
jgi:hypothetical protein